MGESQGVRPVDGLHPPDHHLVDLREREAEITELQKRIQELERGRQEACERVDRLIDRIDLFEQRHDRDLDARAGDDG
jgi:predicted nuclease with TOPRIM domain